MKGIEVSYFHIPEESLDNVILSWWVSRSEEPIELLHTLTVKERQEELASILQQDLPIREFVPIFFVIENAPRSFVDQLDRHRVGFAFWEQSLRVKDLAKNFEYYVPPQLEHRPMLLKAYEKFMEQSRKLYEDLILNGIPRDQARGVIPLHIDVRLSVQCNLRSLLNMLKGRMCYFAQGDYWRPVVKGLLEGLWEYIPSLKDKGILTLPCTDKKHCPFEKDILDRIEDKSNPVCPVLLTNFLPIEQDYSAIMKLMEERYPDYVKKANEYRALVGNP